MGAFPGDGNQASTDLNACKAHRIKVTGVANTNTLTTGTGAGSLPHGMVAVAWEPETGTEAVGVALTTSAGVQTVTFATSGATSFDGWLYCYCRGTAPAAS